MADDNDLMASVAAGMRSTRINWAYLLCGYGPLARYVKLRVAHAPGMPGTFSPPPWVSDSIMHHGTCLMHVPWCMSGSLTSGFLWSRWWWKYSWHSRRMPNPQFYLSGKGPMLGLWKRGRGGYHGWIGIFRLLYWNHLIAVRSLLLIWVSQNGNINYRLQMFTWVALTSVKC